MSRIDSAADLTKFIIGGIRAADSESQEARTKEIHASDLLLCLRKAYLDKELRPELPDSKILMFVAGKGHHDRLEASFKKDGIFERQGGILYDIDKVRLWQLPDGETRMEWNGILGSMDAIYQGCPVEIKTNYSYKVADTPAAHYIKQLKSYCTMLGSNIGYLVVFYVAARNQETRKREPVLVSYKITFTGREIYACATQMVKKKGQLEEAMTSGKLPPKVAKMDKWLCGHCEHKVAERCGGVE